MKILISNDDGIQALGIRTLAEVLHNEHEVYVVAPDRERSASGHSLTLHKPLRADNVCNYINGIQAWQINGTPSDCVKLGTSNLLIEQPDIVVSGINRGPNLGTDVLYSGTVSAAMEGALMGFPAIAVSSAGFSEGNYGIAAQFILNLLKQISNISLPPYTILNVNVPDMDSENIKGTKITRLGVRKYNETFEQINLGNKHYYWLKGDIMDVANSDDSDIVAIENNYISITPLHYDLTLHSSLENLKPLSDLN